LEAHHITPVWTGISGGATFYLEFMMFPLMQDLISPSLGSTDLSDALATGKVKWTDPRMVTALEEEKTIASNYLEDNYAGQNWQQMPGDFASGKAAMLLDGSWDISSVLQANPKMQIGYFPLPGSNTAADNQPVSNADLTWVVLNNSKNKALAEKWLSFFATPSIYSQYVDATGISPSESGSYTSATAKIMGKWFGQGRLIQQTPNFLLPSGPYDLQPTNFWNEQLKMLEGGISPAALAQEYQNAQNQVSQ
jgi:raffinose/stachyose/melibiose transport system substrate-binding protein